MRQSRSHFLENFGRSLEIMLFLKRTNVIVAFLVPGSIHESDMKSLSVYIYIYIVENCTKSSDNFEIKI